MIFILLLRSIIYKTHTRYVCCVFKENTRTTRQSVSPTGSQDRRHLATRRALCPPRHPGSLSLPSGEEGSSVRRDERRERRPDAQSCASLRAPSRRTRVSSGRARVRNRTHERSSLVDPASSHMLVSKIKPCMSQCMPN